MSDLDTFLNLVGKDVEQPKRCRRMVNPVDVCWSFPTNLPIDTYVGGRVVYQCPICVRRCYDDSNYPTRKITDVEADETEST